MIINKTHIIKTNRREKFWFHNIRAMNYFAFRYWWLLLLLFLLYIIFWYFFCFKVPNKNACNSNFIPTVESIKAKLDSCCDCATAVAGPPPPDTAVVGPSPDTIVAGPLLPPPPDCPDRLLVFQVCNNNALRDDDFSVFLNGVNIGKLELNSNDKIGSIFIASRDRSTKIVRADFSCPISNMQVYYFDPGIVRYGNNKIELRNIKTNGNNNEGIIEIRNYLKLGNNLSEPCKVIDIDFKMNNGESLSKSFNYTKCCE
jgi:hypothetical protein